MCPVCLAVNRKREKEKERGRGRGRGGKPQTAMGRENSLFAVIFSGFRFSGFRKGLCKYLSS